MTAVVLPRRVDAEPGLWWRFDAASARVLLLHGEELIIALTLGEFKQSCGVAAVRALLAGWL